MATKPCARGHLIHLDHPGCGQARLLPHQSSQEVAYGTSMMTSERAHASLETLAHAPG